MAEILYESNYYGVSSLGDSLEHHGIKGQKWGIRRFQNPDGSLTALGKQRYGTVENFNRSQERKSAVGRALKGIATAAASNKKDGSWTKATPRALPLTARNQDSWAAKPKALPGVVTRSFAGNSKKQLTAKEQKQRKEMAKKIVKGVAIGAAVGATAYAAYRIGTRPSSLAKTLGSIKKMSDEELLARLGRLEKEKKVLDIIREQQGLYENSTKKILKAAGKGAATTVASAGALYGAKQGIKYAAKRAGKDGDKLIRDMFPKKK